MSDNFYSASLSRTQGRNTWAVIFRHPKWTDRSAVVTFFPMEDVRKHLSWRHR